MEELPHTNNHRTVPTLGALPMGPAFGAAGRRIDEPTEVTQLVISPPGFGHTFIPGAFTWGFKTVATKRYRASEVVS